MTKHFTNNDPNKIQHYQNSYNQRLQLNKTIQLFNTKVETTSPQAAHQQKYLIEKQLTSKREKQTKQTTDKNERQRR